MTSFNSVQTLSDSHTWSISLFLGPALQEKRISISEEVHRATKMMTDRKNKSFAKIIMQLQARMQSERNARWPAINKL